MSTLSDVLIVGSGPTGLVCALTLAQNGVPVRIIEKLSDYPAGQRGAGIMPRTLEIYDFLGLLGDVKAAGGPIPEILQYNAEGQPEKVFSIQPYCEPTPAIPEHNIYMLGQDAACRILRTHLKKYNIQVELSTELVSFEQHDDHVPL
ncbi:hypothetical protein EW146_g6442 [Bondarzewia mesenterica]|uniref:FAD-binding domain-containing protein n=1 Tax=Bondarzewia mesenterica TaxID=1095465 RepID=A0A4S4LPG7_9AGAM|nr:hypothetical protein EW146_g6442 [Bondarzewia mesenterica]